MTTNTAQALTAIPGTILLAGAGKMGGAMLTGWLNAGVALSRIAVVEPYLSDDLRKLTALDLRINPTPDEAGPLAALVVAVKPQTFGEAAPLLKSFTSPATLVLSIMAGVTIAKITDGCGGAVVRSMPNTPAAIGRGMTVAAAAPSVSAGQRAFADALLSAIGAVDWVDDEDLMDAVTAVSGSGPAYIFLLAEELARAGVAAGLPAELASADRTRDGVGRGRTAAPVRSGRRHLAQERHLARRHHRGRARRADGRGRTAATDDARNRRGDEAIEGTGGRLSAGSLLMLRA